MPQLPARFQQAIGRPAPIAGNDWHVRALRLLCVLAMGTMLAACGRCGDFLPSSLGLIGLMGALGACHSDPPPQQ